MPRWDSEPAQFYSQVWQVSLRAVYPASLLRSTDVHSGLGRWQRRQIDFHSLPSNAPEGLLYLAGGIGQEESRQLAHTGKLAAAEGSADRRANRQKTGFIVTERADHPIIMYLSAPVGVLWHHFAVKQQVSYLSHRK